MYWSLFNQHYRHAPKRSCVPEGTPFYKIVVFAGKRFLLSSPPPPSFLFFSLAPTFSTNSRENACYAGYSSYVCIFYAVNNSARVIYVICTNGNRHFRVHVHHPGSIKVNKIIQLHTCINDFILCRIYTE